MVYISGKRSIRNIKRGEDVEVIFVGRAVFCYAAVGQSYRNAHATVGELWDTKINL